MNGVLSVVSEKNRTAQFATWYARNGWHVFPLAAKSKVPLEGTQGFKAAINDPDEMGRVFSATPSLNVGVRTGGVSGFFVLDIDGPEGRETLNALETEHGELPETVAAETGGGGWHLLFTHPGFRIAPGANVFGRKLDVRADDAYIVAPPSIHPNGAEYRWAMGCSPTQKKIADAPRWMLDVLKARCEDRKPVQLSQDGEPLIANDGERHDFLLRMAGKFRRMGMEPGEIQVTLAKINQTRCKPPMTEREVATISASTAKWERGQLIDAPVSRVAIPPANGTEKHEQNGTEKKLRVTTHDVGDGIRQFQESLRMGRRVGEALQMPWSGLNKAFGGFVPNDFMLLAGISGGGKTSIAMNCCLKWAREFKKWNAANEEAEFHKWVLFLALEDDKDSMHSSLAQMIAGLPRFKMRTGNLDDVDHMKLGEAADEIEGLPIEVEYGVESLTHQLRNVTPTFIKERVRSMMERYRKPEVIIIDNTQKVDPGPEEQVNPQHKTMARLSKALEIIPHLYSSRLILLAQEKRDGDSRKTTTKTRGVAIKGSDCFYDDADIVLYVNNPTWDNAEEYKNMRTIPLKLEVRKNRGGPLESVSANFNIDTRMVLEADPGMPNGARMGNSGSTQREWGND